MSMRLVGH